MVTTASTTLATMAMPNAPSEVTSMEREMSSVSGDGIERDGGHAGVVHGSDGEAHHDGAGDFGRAEFAVGGAQTEGDQQRGDRNDDRDENRRGDDAKIVAANRGEAHRGHADVVHGCDSGAHGDAGREDIRLRMWPRLTNRSATAEARMAARSESRTVGRS